MISAPTIAGLESLVGEIADQFTDELNQGRSPSIEAYAERYPEIAHIIRQVFPSLALLDGMAATGPPIDHHGDHIVGVLGDFRILREIGRGGMGVVYEAEQISLGRRVALKVLPFAAMLDKQQLARFKNEARAAATLDHPNIVAIYSVGAERGVHYYAMQLIEGQSLAEVIAEQRLASKEHGAGSKTRPPRPSGEGRVARNSPWRGEGTLQFSIRNPKSEIEDFQHEPGRPPSDGITDPPAVPNHQTTAGDTARVALPTVRANGSAALSHAAGSLPAYSSREYYRAVARLGIQAAEALDHAHQNGILHRDIKPANLLMDDAGKLWIADFGLARIEQDAGMTMTGDLLGTLRYMSPEQALAKRVVVDHRSDIYSLGATLYELLTLRPVFTGDDRQELLRQIAFDEPRKPRQINARIPQDLETIVLKAIEKNPTDRYATAQQLADDLRRFVSDRPITAKRPNLLAVSRKWTRRHRTATAVVTCAAILMLMLFAALVADHNRRMGDASRFVESSVEAALTALETNQISEAGQRLSEAQTRIDADQLGNQAQVEQVVALQQEAKRYVKFVPLVEKAHLDRSAQEIGIAPADEALSLYGVMDHENWLDALRAGGLPDAHIRRVTEDVYELLLHRADHLVRWSDHWPEPTRQARLERQCEEAVRCLNKAISFHAPSRGYYWLLANCALIQNDRDKEKGLRKIALETAPHDAAELFYVNRDRAWGTVSKYRGYPEYTFEESYKDHRAMLRLEPTYYNAMFFMGRHLDAERRYPEALVAWYGCISLRPDDYTAILNRGETHSRLGQVEEAKADYEIVLAARPNSPIALSIIAYAFATDPAAEMRDGKRALELAQKACDLTEFKDPGPLDALAAAYAETGDFESAVKWSEMAVKLCDYWPREKYVSHLESFRQKKPWREK